MKIRRSVSALLAAVLFSALLAFSASAASSSLTTKYNSYHVKDNVNVTVNLSSAEDIGSWDLTLNYNASLLDYVSGADSGGGGKVRFAKASDSAGVKNKSFTVSFKAKAAGSATFTLNVNKLISWDVASISCSGASKTITIEPEATASTVNTLASLVVSPGELKPVFNSNTTAYTVTVPYEKTSITVSANPTDPKARVAVSKTDLEVGENKIAVTVTAESGAKRVYNLTVTREQSEFAGVTATVGGKEMTFAFDPAEITPPAGFSAASSTYGEKKILVFESAGEPKVTAVCLTDGEEKTWYLYDTEEETFSPFTTLSREADSFVLLPLPADAEPPEGYEAAELTYQDVPLTVFRPAEPEKEPATGEEPAETKAGTETETGTQTETAEGPRTVYVAYALDETGNAGYYYFDSASGDLFPYFEPPRPAEEKPDEPVTPVETDPEDLPLVQALRREVAALKDEVTKWQIIGLGLGVLAAALLIALILVAVFKGRNKRDPYEGGFDESPRMKRKIRKQEKAEKKQKDQEYDTVLFGN